MFRFTIRELVLVTLVVALALGWGLHSMQLRSALGKANRALESEEIKAGAWEDRAMSLVEEVRQAGWRADVTQTTLSLQWPDPAIYGELLEERRRIASGSLKNAGD